MRRDPLVRVIYQECLIISSASNIVRPRQALSRKGHGRGEERINYQDHAVLIVDDRRRSSLYGAG